MNGTNLFKIAFRALANNKLRAFLTMLGIIIGVASVNDSLPKVEQIKVDAQLKTIDIMHFGWNIGKAFAFFRTRRTGEECRDVGAKARSCSTRSAGNDSQGGAFNALMS